MQQRLDHPGPVDRRPLRQVEGRPGTPGPGEIAIDVTACAVCRTDLQLVQGDLSARRLPIVPGHQIVGRVAAVGEGVGEWSEGNRVGVGWLAGACGACRHCASGRENLCEQAEFTGWDRDGGFATRAVVRADFAYPLPNAFDDVAAAPLLCGGVIGYRSLKVSGVQSGERLGLYGFGASARLAIQVARNWGCEVFVATRSRREQQAALDLGAVWAGPYHERPPAPLDAAITFAPVGYVAVEALKSLDRGGTLAINAIHLDRVPEFPYELLWWERSIRSVANFTRDDARRFLAVAGELPITTRPDPYPLADANLAMLRLARGEVDGVAVLTMG